MLKFSIFVTLLNFTTYAPRKLSQLVMNKNLHLLFIFLLLLLNASFLPASANNYIKNSPVTHVNKFFAAPTVQASNLTFSNITTTGMTVSWVNGNGANRAVFLLPNGTLGVPPVIDGTTYTVGSYGTTAAKLGSSDWYCVYKGTGTSANISNLVSGMSFRYMVVEFNGTPGSEQYLTSTGTNNPKAAATLSTDAYLSSLVVTPAALSPFFDINNTAYNASVAATTSSITVRPVSRQANSVIKVNGIVVASGSASPAINLSPGNNTITTVVTAQDGVSSRTYTIIVTKATTAPAISYPDNVIVYKQGVPITPLIPVNSGGAVPNIPYGSTTVVTNGGEGYADGNGSIAKFSFSAISPTGMATDLSGNVYISDGNVIRKITPSGVVSTLAGNVNAGYADGNGTAASFNNPKGIAIDANGNLFIADLNNNRIRMVTPNGVVTTFAGSGASGSNNATGISATFNAPYGIAVDNADNLYVTDSGNNLIRKITPTAAVSTFAGDGNNGSDDGPGTSASFSNPRIIAIDKQNNNIYLSDNSNTIRKITPAAFVSTFLQKAASALTVDAMSNVYFAAGDNKIYKVDASGIETIVTSAFASTVGMVGDNAGNMYVANGFDKKIRKVNVTGYIISPDLSGLNFNAATGVISGTPGFPITATDFSITAINTVGSSTTQVNISTLSNYAQLLSLSVSKGFLNPGFGQAITNYVVNVGSKTSSIQVTPTGTNVTIKVNGTIVASGSPSNDIPLNNGDNTITVSVTAQDNTTIKNYTVLVKRPADAPAITYSPASVTLPGGVAITPITPVNSGGAIPAVGYGETSTFAEGFQALQNVTIDPQGILYLSDRFRIKKILPDGTVSTLAGNDDSGSTNGTGAGASFGSNSMLVADALGNVFVNTNGVIRKITPDGVVTKYVTLSFTAGLFTVDQQNNLYVTDHSTRRILKITPAGNVTTHATDIYSVNALTIDAYGTIYIAWANQIKKVSPTGVVTVLAGNDMSGNVDGTGTGAFFGAITGLTLDAKGYLYVTEGANRENNRIRQVSPEGVVTTLSGNTSWGYADGSASTARFDRPSGLAHDGNNTLYVADVYNYRIRKVNTSGYTIQPALPDGLVFDSATGTISGTPTSITPPTDYTINAYNNIAGDQTIIKIETTASENANLSALTLSSGTLSTAFDPALTSYTVTVPNSTSTLTITPVTENSNATARVNGAIVASGSASAPILLNVGLNTITVAISSQSGSVKNYTVDVNRDKAPQTITFAALAPQLYGAGDFAAGATSNSSLTISYSSDNPSVATITNGLIHVVGVGNANITASQSGDSNYNAAIPITQALTINPAILTVTANNLSKNYSDANPPLTATYTGFVNGETEAVLLTQASLSTTAAQLSPVGSYPITVSGASAANYSPNFIAGTLTVNPAPAPTISNISTGTGTSGTVINITGTYFLNATAVTFGGIPATSYTVNSATSITATVGNGANGSVNVTTATGTATFNGFTYVFTLPSNNFNLTITSATCRGTNDGSLNVTTSKVLNYTAQITGASLNTSHNFTSNLNINNLAAGTYNVCITVAGQASYQQCYTVVIKQPENIAMYTSIVKETNSLLLSLQGASTYHVSLNGKVFTTNDSQLSLKLAHGTNNITVSTDKPCQGTLSKSITFNDDVLVYPNPFLDLVNVNLGNNRVQKAIISVFDINNKLVYTKSYVNQTGVLQLGLDNLNMGLYILKLSADDKETFFKIIKK
jgi:sugar lactone lactonase YvrE